MTEIDSECPKRWLRILIVSKEDWKLFELMITHSKWNENALIEILIKKYANVDRHLQTFCNQSLLAILIYVACHPCFMIAFVHCLRTSYTLKISRFQGLSRDRNWQFLSSSHLSARRKVIFSFAF